MFTINTIKNMFICTLNAICYAAYQALSSDVSICNNDEGRVSHGMLYSALNEVVDAAENTGLFDDIMGLYGQVMWLDEADWGSTPELYGDNVYCDILNALLYGMVQCTDNDINVCGGTDKANTLDMLLLSYYYWMLQAIKEGMPVDESALYRYNELVLSDARKSSNLIHDIDAWYTAEKAAVTSDADIG